MADLDYTTAPDGKGGETVTVEFVEDGVTEFIPLLPGDPILEDIAQANAPPSGNLFDVPRYIPPLGDIDAPRAGGFEQTNIQSPGFGEIPDAAPSGDIGGEPQWYKELRRAFPAFGPWEGLGKRTAFGPTGLPVDAPPEAKDIVADYNAAAKFAADNGIVGSPRAEEEDEQTVFTEDEVMGQMPPGGEYETFWKGPGQGYGARAITQEEGYATEMDAIGIASEAKFRNYRVVEGSDGRWHIQHQDPSDPKGQIFADFDDANDNTPAGFRPVQRTDGMWVYERAPVAEKQRIENLEEMFWDILQKKGPAAAREFDVWRDEIEGHRVTKAEAIEFAARWGNDDGSNLVEMAQLFLDFTTGSSFASDLQGAALGLAQANSESLAPLTQQQKLDAALNGVQAGGGRQTAALQAAGLADPFANRPEGAPPGSTGPGGVPTSDTAARIFAQGEADAAVAEAGLEDDPQAQEELRDRVFNEVFAETSASFTERDTLAAEERAKEAADPFSGIDFTPQRQEDGSLINIRKNEDDTLRTDVFDYVLTDAEYEQQVADSRAAGEAAIAAGTNFVTNAAGERVARTIEDYIPERRLASRISVESSTPGAARSLQTSDSRVAAAKAAPKKTAPRQDSGAAIQSEIDEGVKRKKAKKHLEGKTNLALTTTRF